MSSIDKTYQESPWFQFLDHSMRDLAEQSIELLTQEKAHKKPRFHDYSFIVFPMAKAYEGFLKKYLYYADLIDENTLYDPIFRIGRSLNPDLPNKFKDESWLFDDVQELMNRCNRPYLARKLWQQWQSCRNQLFHYFFPDHVHFIDLVAAEACIENYIEVMYEVNECPLPNRPEVGHYSSQLVAG